VLVGGVLASLDGPGGFWTVVETLIDGFVAVEEVVAAFLRVSLFAVLVVGIASGASMHIIVFNEEVLPNLHFSFAHMFDNKADI
jgi:hypothetical protein